MFVCSSRTVCECGLLDGTSQNLFKHYRHSPRFAQEVWRSGIVTQYSRFSATRWPGRPEALAAVARDIAASRPGHEHLAGLWSDSIECDLLWTCCGLQTEFSTSRERLNRVGTSSSWICPSWSWLSLQSPVSYPHGFQDLNRAYLCFLTPRIPRHLGCGKVQDTVILTLPSTGSCKCLMGECLITNKSTLILRGRVVPCVMKWDKLECVVDEFHCTIGTQKSIFRRMPATSRQDGIGLWMDHDEVGYQNAPRQQKLYVLEVLSQSWTNNEKWAGLLLRRVEGSQAVGQTTANRQYTRYTRAGVITWEVDHGRPDSEAEPGARLREVFEMGGQMAELEIL